MKKRVVIIAAAILLIVVIIAVAIFLISGNKENKEKPDKDTFETESTNDTKEDSTAEDETKDNVEAETEDYTDIVSDVEAAFKAALDYIVSGDKLSAEQKVRNAILENTEITVNSANEETANVSVKYPNAADLLTKASSKLPENASDSDVENMYISIAEAIEDKSVDMIEDTIDVELVEKDGIWNIQWTGELYDAVTGGLYSVE